MRGAAVTAVEPRVPPRVVQVSFFCDPDRREPEALLRAWPTLHGVAAAVARAGVAITVVQAAARDQTIERDGVRFEFVDDARAMPARIAGRIPLVRRPSRLIDRVVSLAPEVLHVHGFAFPFATRQLRAALPKVPMLVQDHASGAPLGTTRRMIWRWGYRGIDAAAFAAREQAAPFVSAGVLRRAMPVFEAIEGSTTFTPGDQSRSRRSTGIFGDPCFLWTGHLDANKDPLVVLDAFERAAPSLPDARLWCCFSSAPLRDDVERRIAGSPVLRERVVLLGLRPYTEMEHHYRSADFFVQMSHREGCSYSTIEALACGTVPLVSDIPSSRRIVGDAGALVPVGDAEALAAAMLEWNARDAVERRAERVRASSSRLVRRDRPRPARRVRVDRRAPVKLALVVPGGVDESGTERVIPALLWLIERLARRHDVHVFALSQEPMPCDWPLLGARVHNVGTTRGRRRRFLRLFAGEQRVAPFDVVHAIFGGVGLPALIAAKRFGLPLVTHLAGGELVSIPGASYGSQTRLRDRLRMRAVMAWSDRITVATPYMQQLATQRGVHAERIPLGVALDRWPPCAPRARDHARPARLLHVADLRPVKDQATLFLAAAALRERGLSFELISPASTPPTVRSGRARPRAPSLTSPTGTACSAAARSAT